MRPRITCSIISINISCSSDLKSTNQLQHKQWLFLELRKTDLQNLEMNLLSQKTRICINHSCVCMGFWDLQVRVADGQVSIVFLRVLSQNFMTKGYNCYKRQEKVLFILAPEVPSSQFKLYLCCPGLFQQHFSFVHLFIHQTFIEQIASALCWAEL